MSRITDDPKDLALKEIDSSGMQKKYLVLSEQERAKGFVRPLRRSYTHLQCGRSTRMGLELCETYARNPQFYGGTFCSGCSAHFPLKSNSSKDRKTQDFYTFTWDEDGEGVGS